jgi:flagellar hook-associated protein 2
MGTVGLSFGSPTSGTGFDVSSTVASIVSNLENVETPWKTQLTALESQDTVISSLGTLFSNLSNDLSSLTDATGIMAQKTGAVSDTSALEITSASSSAVAGTHTVVVKSLATTSSGALATIANASDTLSGSITIQVGTGGTAQAISVPSSNSTLAGLAAAINSSGVGVTANVLTDSSGSRLSLVSGTSGADGTIIVDSASNSIVDTTNSNEPLAYTASSTVPADAQLTVDGENVTSPSNTLTNAIGGITFQLLAPSAQESDGSLEQIQLVIGNDNTDVTSTINTMVSDYNSLVSAMNVQEGNDSSGNPEPLYGSPTLSLLQQQLLGSLNVQNPNGNLDAIAANSRTTLSGSIAIAVGGGTTQKIVIGDAPSSPAADTFYTGAANTTLQDLANTINAAAAGTTMTYTGTAGTSTVASTGTLTAIPDASLALSGSITVQVGSGTAESFVIGDAPSTGAAANTTYLGDDTVTLSSLAQSISDANLGVTASVVTPTGGQSTLRFTSGTTGTAGTLAITSSLAAAGIGVSANVVTNSSGSNLELLSETAGTSGALTVASKISATGQTPLTYSGAAGTSTVPSYGSLTTVANAQDVLSGSISIQVGSGAAQTVDVDPSNTTLAGLAAAINKANIGVTAGMNSAGTALSLLSGTSGTAGTLTVTSNLLDASDTSTNTLNYTNSSDISTLANLGITPSTNYDGTISFDETVLTSALNSDYSGVLGFFQNVNSWGQSFSTLLSDAGTSSSTGMLALAQTANSNSESTLNADISKEESQISIQSSSLTTELNSANEIMQELPSQLDGINELYSAITGYNNTSS